MDSVSNRYSQQPVKLTQFHFPQIVHTCMISVLLPLCQNRLMANSHTQTGNIHITTFLHIQVMCTPMAILKPDTLSLEESNLWQFNITGNKKMYFSLHVKCTTILTQFNHIWSFLTDIHTSPQC